MRRLAVGSGLTATDTQLTSCTGDRNCTVTPGDTMTVNISQGSGDTWSISMTDLGTGVVNEAAPPDGQSFNDCAFALSCPAR